MCPQRRIFFSSRRRHTRSKRDWSSDVCSSDLAVDRDDHLWAVNRRVDARPDELTAATNPPRGECCVLGPEILEFDQDGNVVNAWGGPNYHEGWPGRLQTIAVDRQKNVYLSGTTPGDG